MGQQKLMNLIGVVVLMFIIIVLYLAFADPLNFLYDSIRTSINETGNITNYTEVDNQLSKYPYIFGFFSVCFGIAIIVSYVANAHRKEYEEYPQGPYDSYEEY